jgi:hypothetical protein
MSQQQQYLFDAADYGLTDSWALCVCVSVHTQMMQVMLLNVVVAVLCDEVSCRQQ